MLEIYYYKTLRERQKYILKRKRFALKTVSRCFWAKFAFEKGKWKKMTNPFYNSALEFTKHFHTEYFKGSSPKPRYSSPILCLTKRRVRTPQPYHHQYLMELDLKPVSLTPPPSGFLQIHLTGELPSTPNIWRQQGHWGAPSPLGCPRCRMRRADVAAVLPDMKGRHIETVKECEWNSPKVSFQPTQNKGTDKSRSLRSLRPSSKLGEFMSSFLGVSMSKLQMMLAAEILPQKTYQGSSPFPPEQDRRRRGPRKSAQP